MRISARRIHNPGPSMQRNSVTAWIGYDIALHGYGLMIPSVGYAIYFTSFVAGGHPFADGLWSLAVAIPLLAVGLLSPWLGPSPIPAASGDGCWPWPPWSAHSPIANGLP